MGHFRNVFALFAVLIFACSFASGENFRPIIGILDQPTHGKMAQYGSSYIAASYVKYIESAGARVVPIFHNSTKDELRQVFKSVNGILLPGGGSDLDKTPLFYAGKFLYDLALEANDRGDYFPIMGHCMGFEFLAMITSGDFNILSSFDAEDISLPLNFTEKAPKSRMYGGATQNIYNILAKQPVTMNFHMFGVSPADFQANSALVAFYDVLSVNDDLSQKVFISSFEGKKYPVYGIQWHPEKNNFEWDAASHMNHSPDAVLVSQYMANFFVSEARKNNHAFLSKQVEYNSLIYNYKPHYTASYSTSFEQCYIF